MVGAESVIAPSQRNPVPVRDNTVFTVSAGVRVTPCTRGVFAVMCNLGEATKLTCRDRVVSSCVASATSFTHGGDRIARCNVYNPDVHVSLLQVSCCTYKTASIQSPRSRSSPRDGNDVITTAAPTDRPKKRQPDRSERIIEDAVGTTGSSRPLPEPHIVHVSDRSARLLYSQSRQKDFQCAYTVN